VQQLITGSVQRLILSRPAVEAGERLGFLPGDMKEKVDPYMQPLYDALSITTNPIPLKAALNLLGHDVGGLRLPLVEADAAQTATLQAALEQAGILPVAAG
jgi:hypothetical protein